MLIPACINNFEFIGNYETVLEVSSSQFSYIQRTALYPSQTGRCVPMTINIGYTINRQNGGNSIIYWTIYFRYANNSNEAFRKARRIIKKIVSFKHLHLFHFQWCSSYKDWNYTASNQLNINWFFLVSICNIHLHRELRFFPKKIFLSITYR